MGRSPEWVKENLEWFCSRLDARPGEVPWVWPIVQAYDDPVPILPEEFEKVLPFGLSAGATGVMMFTSVAIAASAGKIETMKRFYSRMRN